MLSRAAIEQGYAVARNILRAVRGASPRPFRYRDPGIMAIVGRNAAVAVVRGIALKGWLGWWAWLAVHLYFLIGFRNRLAALLGWRCNYILYDRPIRFIGRNDHERDGGVAGWIGFTTGWSAFTIGQPPTASSFGSPPAAPR